ncbi:MAG: glycosyltransferase family 4 protein [Cytophagales bacterium]|jgi:glycosyltransferase involved in cell wall biosynthesis|nr:glycosyltransferase family 4 protein [Cytophagales bacterium]MCA6388894.1 glycosyltransferase family 4 protein [Cytophagales bacterium]MCA6391124.1 glycosyltransferase family 4 protein [Cytophagales bacterium]MCA6397731.1 glycosyltransferase family 4 protein [Cytophagales bacterium]MCA6401434.1 glycosyltransferase family 4 protein [Cytophagales bacterium]
MRILLVHNRYKQYGGEDAVVEAERALLANNGHLVELLIFDNDRLSGLFSKIGIGLQLIYNRKSYRKLENKIKEFKPEIIHIHNIFYMASPSVLYAASKYRIPTVVSLHNYRLICSGALLMRDSKPCTLCIQEKFPIYGVKYSCHRNSKLETAQLTFVTGIHKLINTWNLKVSRYIALTEFARSQFIDSSLGILPEKIVVKPSSVTDCGFSSVRERENYFLFVGRLSEEKGVNVLLKTFQDRKIRLEIIGDGLLRSQVTSASAAHNNIHYWGYKDKPFIISRIKKCIALIVPSIWYEGLPITILEAYSTGTPVIVSDLENLNEIVTHGYNGIHFSANDPADLLRCIEEFDLNSRYYADLYSNARETYLSKFTPEINHQNLLNLYLPLLNNGSTLQT